MKPFTPILLSLPLILVKGDGPWCDPPGSGDVDGGMSWYSCQLDENAWYGISKYDTFDRDNAVKYCNSFEGAELISITSEEIDMCTYYTMRLSGLDSYTRVWNSMFKTPQNNYLWCPNGTDVLLGQCYNDEITYTNFIAEEPGYNCGSTRISGNSFEKDYGWINESCDKRANRFICRLDCSYFPKPTTTPAPTTTVRTTTTKNSLPPWEIQVDVTINEGDFGEWQAKPVMCPYNFYVCGISTRSQAFKGAAGWNDDTMLNGISISCCDSNTKEWEPVNVTISTGFEGSDYDYQGCVDSGKHTNYKYVCGLKTRYEYPPQSDNTGLNGIEMKCCDRYIWGSDKDVLVVSGGFGEWQDDFVTCPNNYYMCGLQMQEQAQLNRGDNTAANGVKAVCCAKP